jgi:mxaJ protein
VKRIALLAWCFAGAMGGAQAQDTTDTLRVCADPDNMPYSREDGSGFENRIAELLAQDMHVPLRYAWLPDRRGFVRKTLGAQLCDVIIGVPVGFERTGVTQPYYRSRYAIVQRADAAPVTSLDDPRLAGMRIGVQLIGNDAAASPPAMVLARRGIVRGIEGFPLAGETPAAQRAVEAIARGDIDAAILWGPQAGWYASQAAVPMQVTVLQAPPDAGDQPFEFAIGMGVRRPDKALRARLDDFIRRRQPDIDRILAAYAVPRADGGRP